MLIFAPSHQAVGLVLEFLLCPSCVTEQAQPLFSLPRNDPGSGQHQNKGIWGFASEGDEDSRMKTQWLCWLCLAEKSIFV